MLWGPNPNAVTNPEAAQEAQDWSMGFLRGRAGAVGWPAKTNLKARSNENPNQVPINAHWQQGYTFFPAPNEASPTTVSYPMRGSDTLRVYESQLVQIQNQLMGTP